jgi:benzoylformate decarboxylase
MPTVRDVTFNLLRRLELTTIVGNPGSTEETFLQNFPSDFQYILALHESSVVGIAEGIAQSLRKPVIINVHTNAGLGNAMGNIITAYSGKSPLIVTAGQQTRDMLLSEPFLANVDAEMLPRPWVKWSYEPKRARDVPGAFMRAYATAIQQPAGPVFLSLPMDDWDQTMDAVDVFRSTSTRIAPDPRRVAEFAEAINLSRNPVLVFGGDVARSNAWDEGIAFAEKLNAPVWLGPLPDRVPFPQDHQLYAGILPPAIGALSKTLHGHDLVVVIGAPVFRYYPWVPGEYLPSGARLLHITDDSNEAARAVAGDSLVGDSGLALVELAKRVTCRKGDKEYYERKNVNHGSSGVENAGQPLTAKRLFEVLSECVPDEYVVVNESPSNMAQLSQTKIGTITKPDSYYLTASGGLGWGMPAAVGHAIAEERTGRNRPVIAVMGDGSFQYSVQSIWTAVQLGLHVVYVVLKNEQYGILKAFALKEGITDVPGLDIPGIDILSLGKGYGAAVCRAETVDRIKECFSAAIAEKRVTVIEVPIDKG